jgi:hypothetical protein
MQDESPETDKQQDHHQKGQRFPDTDIRPPRLILRQSLLFIPRCLRGKSKLSIQLSKQVPEP